MTNQSDWIALTALRDSDSASRIELVGRFVLVGCGTLTVAYATGDPVLALWFLCYFATQVIYLGHLWRQRQPLSRLAYPLAVALNVLTSSTFLALPLYLWHQHTPMFQAAAVLMLWGHSAYNLSRRGGVRAVAIWDALSVVTVLIYLVANYARSLTPEVTYWIPVFVACIAAIYYVLSIRENYLFQCRLARAETAAIQKERLDAVGQIAAGVTHDFNNILTSILGQFDLYDQTTDATQRDTAVAAARKAARRAATLTRQLQSYAQQTVLNPQPHQLDLLLRDIHAAAMIQYRDTVEISLTLSRSLLDNPGVTLDSVQMQASLAALIANAVEASAPHQTVAIKADFITLRSPSAPINGVVLPRGRYVLIAVHDNGAGITPQHRDHVLEPFYSTKASPRSSGLGLPMALGFSQQSGGALEVTSVPRKGTSVTLILPA